MPEAYGIARCGRAAPIGLVEGYELITLVSAKQMHECSADLENFAVFGRSSAWQHANVLQIGV